MSLRLLPYSFPKKTDGMEIQSDRDYFFGDIASQGQTSQLQSLILSGASVNVVAVDSITPLHEACLRGQTQCKEDCVKLLIAMGANLEAYDIYYGTPLHVACANEHTDCVKVLLNAGAKVNAARLHETPLHHATKNKQVEMVEILVEFGANVHARDHHDKKPVDYTTPGSPSATCLQFYETTPMNLQQLSRLALRAMLETRALEVIEKLDIPKLIIGYLCYQKHLLTLSSLAAKLENQRKISGLRGGDECDSWKPSTPSPQANLLLARLVFDFFSGCNWEQGLEKETVGEKRASSVCQSESDSSHCSVLHELQYDQAALTGERREDGGEVALNHVE
ncbi:hypothetical protein F7725_022022 [Dissostichus mawsoni]|uniref:SOCS box domain-containing protein n=1 Tax=Dissostichus mawsoni TaxID=36200 RepID=A0A7J5ZDG1_DISMA|nr:hypothetical protein F7725_022022 [Dissostichus mawsoni]